MAEELREAGVSIDDGKLSLIALNGLDTSYDPFVMEQTSQINNIIFASLLGPLRSYKSHLNCSTEVCNLATANFVQSAAFDTIVIVYQICRKHEHLAIACYNCYKEQRFPTQHDKMHS